MSALPKFSMAFTADDSQLKSVTAEVRREVTSTSSAAAASAKGIDQHTAALDRMGAAADMASAKEAEMRRKVEKLTLGTPVPANVNLPISSAEKMAKGAALANHEVTNLSFQLSDMAVMLASGQSPFLMMMQQGSQVSQIMGSRGLGSMLPAIGQGLMSLINPTTLVLGGLTAAGYAGYTAFRSFVPEIESADEVISRHASLVGKLKGLYGDASAGVKGYAADSKAVLAAEVAQARDDFKSVVLQSSKGALDNILGRSAEDIGRTTPLFGQIVGSVNMLKSSIEQGNPRFREFRDIWARIEVNPLATESQRAMAKEIRETTTAGATADQQLRSLPTTFGAIGKAASQYGKDVDAFGTALERLAGIAAVPVSPRDQALDQYRKARSMAGDLESSRKALTEYEATLKRIENMEAGAGVPIPTRRPSELSMEPVVLPGAEYLTSQQEQIELLKVQLALGGQSEVQQRKMLALYEAETLIRKEGIGVQSARANEIRQNAAALSEMKAALDQQTAAWEKVRDVGRGAIDTLVDKLSDGDFAGALKSISGDLVKTLGDLSIGQPMRNSL